MSKLDEITKLMLDEYRANIKNENVYKYFTIREIGKNLGIVKKGSLLYTTDDSYIERQPSIFDVKKFKVAVDKDGNILTDGTNNFKEILGDQYTWLFNEK
jgi:hypothetical protein